MPAAAKSSKATAGASKTPTKSPKSPSGPPHPKYSEMVKEAITELKDRKGSSKRAIQKYIQEKYSIEENPRTNQHMNRTLRAMLDNNEIHHHSGQKATGANGSFRLGASGSSSSGEEKRGRPKTKSTSPSKPKAKKASPVKHSPSPKKASSPKKGKK